MAKFRFRLERGNHSENIGTDAKPILKRYRQGGAAEFFKSRQARQPRVLTPEVRHKAQELLQQGQGRQGVAQQLGLKADTLRKAIKAGRIVEPVKKK